MRARVLIAEDDDSVRQFLQLMLSLEGYEVAAAGDGVEAIEEIERCRPDVLLLDLMMPRMDGFEVVRQLRGDPDHSDLPIIMLSARCSDAERMNGAAVGADSYVGKPVEPADLLRVIGAVLNVRAPA